MSVARARREIDRREFVQWQVYESLEPGEPFRSDWRMARVCSLIANIHRGKGPPVRLSDFLPNFGGADVLLDGKTLRAKIKATFGAIAAHVRPKG
jgi:hypothetical protein